MRKDNSAKEENVRKVGKDGADTFGVRGTGASWQALGVAKVIESSSLSSSSRSAYPLYPPIGMGGPLGS